MVPIESSFTGRKLFAAVLPLGLLLGLGCGKKVDMPVTHPASGKVAYEDGQPMKGGAIEFAPSAPDAAFTVTGEVDDNGSFSLHTLKGKHKAAGAVEGKYKVTIMPPQTADHQSMKPVTLSGTYTVKAGENVFPTFKIARPEKRPGAPPVP